MPHVVFACSFDVDAWSSAFSQVYEETEQWRIKIEEIYVERQEKRVILPTVVIEEGHTQTFYIKVTFSEERNRLTVRLDPLTDPVKTRGVKRSIGLIAESLSLHQPCTIDKNNVEEFFSLPGSTV